MSALAAVQSLACIRVLRLHEAAEWTALVDLMPAKDLTHYPRFAAIYQDKGDGIAECFVYENRHGRVIYPYLLRPLTQLPFVPKSLAQRYDIITPYCYGGPIHDASAIDAPKLWPAFRGAFDTYARQRGAVTEFVRFHPDLQNQRHADDLLDRLYQHRDNVTIDLRPTEPERTRHYRASYRQCLQRARDAGLRFEVATDHDLIESFARLYRATMERHRQTGYLNFPSEFFQTLFRHLAHDAVLVGVRQDGRLAASAIFLRYGTYYDYFLSASDAGMLGAHPNHFMIHEFAGWARQQGGEWLHLGGGRESLVFFKSGFSPLRQPFYVGHRIHDQIAYQMLAAARITWPHAGRGDPGFFPAYRAGLE